MTPASTRSSSTKWILALLCLMYGFSLVDRMMPTLLVEDLARDLNVSHVQFGLLFGTSFGLLYAIAGIPLAAWIDRGNRKWILFGGLLLWSLSTVVSGLVDSYFELLLARIGLAVGEAALIPVAMSIIADLYEPGQRNVPLSIFVGCGVAMGTGSFLVCGGALALSQYLSPLLGVADWRLSFVLVGIPPLLLALLWAGSVREPARVQEEQPQGPNAGSLLAYLIEQKRLYGPLLLTVTLINSLATGAMAWFPTIIAQEYGLSLPQAATTLMATLMPVALAAWALAPFLALVAERRRLPGGAISIMMFLVALCMASAVLLAWAKALPVALAGIAGMTLALASLVILNMLLIQWISPSWCRGRLTAVGQLANSLGFAAGAPLVAVLEGGLGRGPGHLSTALAVTVIMIGSTASVFIFLLVRPTGPARRNQVSGR